MDVVRDKGLLDPVTGLPNRVLLFDLLDQALRRARVRGAKTTLVPAARSSRITLSSHHAASNGGTYSSGQCEKDASCLSVPA
jgi:hypothetical protein